MFPRLTPVDDEYAYPPGRRCTRPDCITVLNHLNPGPDCLQHTEAETLWPIYNGQPIEVHPLPAPPRKPQPWDVRPARAA